MDTPTPGSPGINRLKVALAVVALTAAAGPTDDPPVDRSFGLTDPVVCKEIHGFEDFVLLEPASVTADEKLLLYYRPLHYKTETLGSTYRIHLTQDGRLRRKGQTHVLWKKDKMVDYEVKSEEPPRPVYIRNTVGLKGLRPGAYEFDVVVHDQVGRSEPAVRTVGFHVIPSPAQPAPEGPKPEGDTPGRSGTGPRNGR